MMCRKSSAPMSTNLYPLTEFDNESPVLPCEQTNHPSRMKAFKRRSCTLNYLYKNVMDKKHSADIVSIEHLGKDPAPNSRASTPKSSQNSSRMNSSSTLSLSLAGDSRAPKTRNPISFYENDLNLTRFSSNSSTVDLPTTGRIKLPRRAHSSQEIKKVSSFKNEPIGISRSNPDIKEVITKAETPGKESDDDVSKILCDEISTALNDDIFEKEFSFDNKWVDDDAFNSLKDHSDVSSSSHSPLTDSALKSSANPISRRDSLILQNFKGDLNALTKKKTRNSISSKSNSSRLQLRLDTLRMKSESTRDTQRFHSDVTNTDSDTLLRYWTTNTDIRTKSVSEGINRELKSVTRCNSYSGRPGGKMIVSMINQLSIEKQGESQMGNDSSSSSSESTLSAHPAIKNINCTQNDLLLTNFLDDNLHRRNSEDMFEDKALTSIGDKELRNSIVRGRSHSNRMWLESERLEFD